MRVLGATTSLRSPPVPTSVNVMPYICVICRNVEDIATLPFSDSWGPIGLVWTNLTSTIPGPLCGVRSSTTVFHLRPHNRRALRPRRLIIETLASRVVTTTSAWGQPRPLRRAFFFVKGVVTWDSLVTKSGRLVGSIRVGSNRTRTASTPSEICVPRQAQHVWTGCLDLKTKQAYA